MNETFLRDLIDLAVFMQNAFLNLSYGCFSDAISEYLIFVSTPS
jgi:hypothetical protein